MTCSPYVIGVLILPPLQLLDLAAVDLFGMISKEYLDSCPLPDAFRQLAHPDVRIHYIASSSTIAECTSNLGIRTTHTIDSPEAKAGQLDVLLIPGPDPSHKINDVERQFIQDHATSAAAKEKKTTVMTVCTGIFSAGQAGILDGHRVTGPRGLLSNLKSSYPKANWAETRWESSEDGLLWTSAGITNGQDMVAAYLHSPHAEGHGVSSALADLVCRMADVGNRQQQYDTSGPREGLWWGLLMLRSLWKGNSGKSVKT